MNDQYWNGPQGQAPRPGIGKPVVIGAAVGITIYALLGWLPALAMGGMPCCCVSSSLGGLAAGAVGALLAQRRDPVIGVGGAFVVGLLAAGISGLVSGGVLAAWFELPPELADEVRQGVREAQQQDPNSMSAEQAEQVADWLVAMFRFTPFVDAVIHLLVGTAAALVTALLVAGRRRPPPAQQQQQDRQG